MAAAVAFRSFRHFDRQWSAIAGFGPVHPSICWLQMQALAEGARIATKKLWGRSVAN